MKFIKLFETDIDFYDLYSEEYILSIPLYVVSNKETKELGEVSFSKNRMISEKGKEILRNSLFFHVNKIIPEIDIKEVTIYYYFEEFIDEDKEAFKNKSGILLDFLMNDTKTKGWWYRFVSNAKLSSIDLPIQDISQFKNSKERFVISLNGAKTDYSKF